MDTEKYFDYILSETQKILAIDSPSGFTRNVADYVLSAYRALGYEPVQTVKGGVFCEIGGADTKDALLMEAHIDTLGAMVSEDPPERLSRALPDRRHEREQCRGGKLHGLHERRQNLHRHFPVTERLHPCQRGLRLHKKDLRKHGSGAR